MNERLYLEFQGLPHHQQVHYDVVILIDDWQQHVVHPKVQRVHHSVHLILPTRYSDILPASYCVCLLQNCEPSIEIKLLHGLPLFVPLFNTATHRGLSESLGLLASFLATYFL